MRENFLKASPPPEKLVNFPVPLNWKVSMAISGMNDEHDEQLEENDVASGGGIKENFLR